MTLLQFVSKADSLENRGAQEPVIFGKKMVRQKRPQWWN